MRVVNDEFFYFFLFFLLDLRTVKNEDLCSTPRTLVATASVDKNIKVWDFEKTTQCILTLAGHSNTVRRIVFALDIKKLFSSSADKTVKMWDLSTGKCLKTMSLHKGRVYGIDISPNGELVASGDDNNQTFIWSAHDGSLIKEINCSIYNWLLSFSPDGNSIYVFSSKIEIIETSSGTSKVLPNPHTDPISSFTFTKDGNYLITGSEDYKVKILDVKNNYKVVMTLSNHSNTVTGLAISPDGMTLASSSLDKTIIFWDILTGCLLNKITEASQVYSVKFSPDGNFIMSGASDSSLKIWDVTTRTCVNTFTSHSSVIVDLTIKSLCLNCSTVEANGCPNCFCDCSNPFLITSSKLNNCLTLSPDTCSNCTGPAKNKTCVKCNNNCATCSEKPEICSSCAEPFFLSNKDCVEICPKPTWGNNSTRKCELNCEKLDEYGDSSNRICKSCNKKCATCLNSEFSCLSCNTPLFLFNKTCLYVCPIPFWGVNGKCEENCSNANEYGDIADRVCKKCNQSCATCSDSSIFCTTCHSEFFLSETSCVARCPKPFWGNMLSRKCEESCNKISEFSDESDRTCKNCDNICETCSGKADYCLSCSFPRYLSGSKCVEMCQEPLWGNNITKKCEVACANPNEYGEVKHNRICMRCDSFCATCIENASNCLSCEKSLYLNGFSCVEKCPLPLWGSMSSGKCEENCSRLSEFGDISGGKRICKACDPSCKTCAGAASNCSSCEFPKFLLAHTCILVCPSPLWGNNETRVCVNNCSNKNEFGDVSNNRICTRCNPSCTSCWGKKDSCLSCPSSKYLSNSECVTECPFPLWGNDKTNTCELECLNSNEFGDAVSKRVCKPCDPNCRQCKGDKKNCTLCFDGYFLRKEFTNEKNFRCDDCSSGGIKDEKNGFCGECQMVNCLKCENLDKCSTCELGFDLLKNASCKNCSSLNSFFNNLTKECEMCPSNCSTCANSSFCLSCQSGFRFNDTGKCALQAGLFELPFTMIIEDYLRETSSIVIATNKPFKFNENKTVKDFFHIKASLGNETVQPLINQTNDQKVYVLLALNSSGILNTSVAITDIQAMSDFDGQSLREINGELVENRKVYEKKLESFMYFYTDENAKQNIQNVASVTKVVIPAAAVSSILPIIIFQNFYFFWAFLDCVQIASFFLMINVEYHPLLASFLNKLLISHLDFLPDVLKSLFKVEARALNNTSKAGIYQDQRAPKRFHDLNYSANIFENSSSQIEFLCLVFAFVCMISIMQSIFKKSAKGHRYLSLTDKLFRYSVFILIHNFVFLKLFLASNLQLTAFSTRHYSFIFSFSTALVINLYLTAFLYWIFRNTHSIKYWLLDPIHSTRFKILYSSVSDYSFFTRSHIFFLMLQKYFFCIILVWAHFNTYLQIGLLITLQLLWCIHYIFNRPYNGLLRNIVQGLSNIVFLLCYCMILFMHIINKFFLISKNGQIEGDSERILFILSGVICSLILVTMLLLFLSHIINIGHAYVKVKGLLSEFRLYFSAKQSEDPVINKIEIPGGNIERNEAVIIQSSDQPLNITSKDNIVKNQSFEEQNAKQIEDKAKIIPEYKDENRNFSSNPSNTEPDIKEQLEREINFRNQDQKIVQMKNLSTDVEKHFPLEKLRLEDKPGNDDLRKDLEILETKNQEESEKENSSSRVENYFELSKVYSDFRAEFESIDRLVNSRGKMRKKNQFY